MKRANLYQQKVSRISDYLLRGSRVKQDSSLRTNSTWQVDTYMVLPQTNYTLITYNAMPQILYRKFMKRQN